MYVRAANKADVSVYLFIKIFNLQTKIRRFALAFCKQYFPCHSNKPKAFKHIGSKIFSYLSFL